MADFVLPSDQDAAPAAAPAPATASSPAGSSVPAPFVLPSDADDAASGGTAPLTVHGGAQPRASTLGTVVASPFVGFNRGLANVVGAPVDALNWAMGKVGLPTSSTPFAGSESIKRGLGMIGADPDKHQANSAVERYLQAGGEGAASMIAPEAAVGALGRAGALAPKVADLARGAFGSAESLPAVAGNAAVGATASLGAEAGQDLAPERYKPAAAMAGSLIAGGVPALGAAGLSKAAAKGMDAFHDYVRPLREEGRQEIAGAALRGASGDPVAVADALDTMKPLVPGSTPTTFQVTGDMGLGSLERTEAAQSPELYQQRRADQNAARLDALGTVQPTGDPSDLSGFFNRQLGQVDDFYGTLESAARNRAQGAAASLPGTDSPEAVGSALRGNIADARAAVKERERALWDAVDPDNTLANSIGPIKAKAASVYDELPQADAANLSGPETTMLGLVKGYAPVEPFREVASLRSNLAQAMRDELTSNGKSPAYGRMSGLMDAVQGVINNTVEGRAAHEAHAVSTGAMAPEDTIAARLTQDFSGARPSPEPEAGRATGTADGNGAVARASDDPGQSGAEVSDGRSTGHAPGGQGVPQDALGAGAGAAPPQDLTPPARLDEAPTVDPSAMPRAPQHPGVPRPQSLHSFVRSLGGVQDPGGDLAAMGLHSIIARSGKGLGPDAVRQVAAEAGYLGGDTTAAMRDTTINDLHNALEEGDRRYSVHDEDAVLGWHEYDQGREAWRRQRAESDGPSSPAGPRPKAPLSSYSPDDIYPPGMAPAPHGTPEPANGALVPNYDAAAAARLKEASAATKERAETFDQGVIGGVLRTQGSATNYRTMDAKIPGTLFAPGPAGKQVADGYFRAVGRTPQAMSDFVDAAALSLRRAAVKDGMVDPDRLAAWQARHADALRAAPDAAKHFADAAAATRTYAGLAEARRKAVDGFQAGAIGKVMGQNDPVKGVATILGRSDAAAQMRDLARRASADPAAAQGLRKAVVDHIMAKLVSNTEAATSGKNLLKNDQFQTFIRQNRAALQPVFSDKELGLMQAMADDLHRANRSITAVKLPGQSNTAQDLTALAAKEPAPQTSLLTKLIAGAGAGMAAHGPVGAAVGAGSAVGQHILGGMREAGMRKVGELVRDAMLNPDLARALLTKAPIAVNRGSELTLRHQLGRLAVFSGAAGASAE